MEAVADAGGDGVGPEASVEPLEPVGTTGTDAARATRWRTRFSGLGACGGDDRSPGSGTPSGRPRYVICPASAWQGIRPVRSLVASPATTLAGRGTGVAPRPCRQDAGADRRNTSGRLSEVSFSDVRPSNHSSRLGRRRPCFIVGLALATGYIHSTLGGLLFTLNAVGYLVAAVAMVIPLSLAVRYRWVVRLGLMGYAATTIIGWAIQGPYYSTAFIAKGIEVALIVLLAIDFARMDGNPVTLIRRELASFAALVASRRQAGAAA